MAEPARRYRFSRRMRLSLRREFQAVFSAGVRHGAGPLLVYGRPNALDHPRLGLTVPRRVGNAVRRNRIKRLLREAFRLSQDELPRGYDFVVVVRPHEPKPLDAYRRALLNAARTIDQRWTRRRASQSPADATDAPGSPPAGSS